MDLQRYYDPRATITVTKCILRLENPLMFQNLLALATPGREQILEKKPRFNTQPSCLSKPDIAEDKEPLNSDGVEERKKKDKEEKRKNFS